MLVIKSQKQKLKAFSENEIFKAILKWLNDPCLKYALENYDRIGTLKIAEDERMKEVYDILSPYFEKEAKKEGRKEQEVSHYIESKIGWFVISAGVAKRDFNKFREDKIRAAELNKDIQRLANRLSKKMRTLESLNVSKQDTFYSIRELLRKTRGREESEFDKERIEKWEFGRDQIIGPIRSKVRPSLSEAFINIRWEDAPSFPDMLDALVEETKRYDPAPVDSLTRSAVITRQKSEKAQYVRPFAYFLHEKQIALTPTIKKAMAITATVGLNDKDVVVSVCDIKKATTSQKATGGKVRKLKPKKSAE